MTPNSELSYFSLLFFPVVVVFFFLQSLIASQKDVYRETEVKFPVTSQTTFFLSSNK